MSDERDTVLFLSAFPYLGGAQVSLATVLRHLPDDVRAVVAVPASGPFVDRIRTYRPAHEQVVIPQLGEGSGVRSRFGIALILWWWLVRNRHRLLAVHANGDSELKLLLPVLPFTRGPIVVWHHRAQLTSTTTSLAPLWRALRRRVVWAAVSDARRKELVEARVGGPTNIFVVPNPIDPDEVVSTVRRRHEGMVVGYLGCEYESKGYTVLPEIARALRDSPITMLCVVKGFDPASSSGLIERATAELRAMPDVVRFRERTFAVSEIFADVDVVLIPSRAESFCRVAAEAMANGLPVVATDLPALQELLDTGAGTLFPVDEGAGAAEALIRLVDEPELAFSMGAEGRRRAAAFAPTQVVQALLELYGVGATRQL